MPTRIPVAEAKKAAQDPQLLVLCRRYDIAYDVLKKQGSSHRNLCLQTTGKLTAE